jgi:predicted house-cleaning noncanonical NTP pyrophosphatase (MazG superfamily)
MPSPELIKQWKATATLLQRARRTITDQSAQVSKLQKEFDEYLEHNELELAMNMLEEIAELIPCRGGFWRDLERAAQMMGLSDRAEDFHTRFLNTKAEV